MSQAASRIRLRCLFLIALVFVLMITVAFNRNAASQDHWRLAKGSAPIELLDQLVQDNLNPDTTIEPGQMKLWIVQQPHQSQPVYLTDTRVTQDQQFNPLCGQQNCLFLGYVQTRDRYQRILNVYLDPHLPPKIDLWQATSELQHGLPCLTAHQLVQQKIQTFKYCSNGIIYEVIETQQFPHRYD